MKEELKLTPEDARNIVWEDSDDFVSISERITGTSRWSILYEKIVQRNSDGKFFKLNYRVGATESQDEKPFEYEKEVIAKEVVAIEKTIIVYE
jgi:hypothetical protein